MPKTDFFNACSYGFLALPLGMLGLPIYVYIPNYYSQNYDISLVSLSIVLMATRLIDTVQDPFLGWVSDKFITFGVRRSLLICLALPGLIYSFYGLLFNVRPATLMWDISVYFLLFYSFFSFISINYFSLINSLTFRDQLIKTCIGVREALQLAGIALGSILPSFISPGGFGLFFAGQASFMLVGILLILRLPCKQAETVNHHFLSTLGQVIKNKPFMKLGGVFLLNTTAAAIPATTFVFFINDFIQLPEKQSLFLSLYFLSAFMGVPIVLRLVKNKNLATTWVTAILVTTFSFIIAFLLPIKSLYGFSLICCMTGFCLGADLIIPNILVTKMLENYSSRSTYYGVWSMITKASMSLAAGIGLFVLGLSDYKPDNGLIDTYQRIVLGLTYAVIPCFIKLITAWCVWYHVVKKEPHHEST